MVVLVYRRGLSPDVNKIALVPDYTLVEAWHDPLNGNLVLNGPALLASMQTPEVAERYIDKAKTQDAATAWQAAAEMATFALHMVPVAGQLGHPGHGDYWEAALSLLGDVAFFAGGPLAKLAGEGTVLAKGLTITAIAADATLGAVRGEQA